MEATYDDLKIGYILKLGDIINIDGLIYSVTCGLGYYLNASGTYFNSDIFKLTSRSDKIDWAQKFGKVVGGAGAYSFPELDSFEALTKFTIAIYEDIHKLKEIREGKETEFPSVKSKSITISLPRRNKTSTHIKL